MPHILHHPSPLGTLTLASDGASLTGLWIEGQKYHGADMGGPGTPAPDLPVFTETVRWLNAYFAGKNPALTDLPLAPRGSAFRKAVWDILCDIPYGTVTTYGAIARQMAAATGRNRMSCQAVGGAVGHNPISIIIPCHRVVGTNGSLTGYAGGLDLKIRLLTLEGADMARFFVPTRGTAL